MTNETVMSALRNGLVEITFEKVNGELRTMTCTLKEDLIPEEHRPKSEVQSIHNPMICRVYEIDKGWRSFRWESLITSFSSNQIAAD